MGRPLEKKGEGEVEGEREEGGAALRADKLREREESN